MTASIWAPTGFSPEIVPLTFFEGVATAGQTVISIAPYTALTDSQLQVFVNGEVQNTNTWGISGSSVVLLTGMLLGQPYRVDVYRASPVNGSELPGQTGQAGKALFTDGVNTSWELVPDPLPLQTGQSGKILKTNGVTTFWDNPPAGFIPSVVRVIDFGYVANNSIAAAATNATAIVDALTTLTVLGGGVLEFPLGDAYVNTVEYTYTAEIPILWKGQGRNSRLKKASGTVTPIIYLKTSVVPRIVNGRMQDLELVGDGTKTHNGLELEGIAYFDTDNLSVRNCNIPVNHKGALLISHYNPYWVDNNYGLYTRKFGAVYSNLINVYGGSIGSNSIRALDLGECSTLNFFGVDFEVNGTALNPATGAVIIRASVDDETGFSNILFDGCWFEANLGRNFVVENAGGLSLTVLNTKLTGNAADACTVGTIASFIWINNEAASASTSDTLTVAAARCTLIGGIAFLLNDTSTNQTYINFQTGTKTFPHFSTDLQISETMSSTAGATTTFYGGASSFTNGAHIFGFRDRTVAGNTHAFFTTNGGPGNALVCALRVGTSSSNGRSINAGGTINASGADYAEYELKRADCRTVKKGDVIGFDSQGCVTDKWSLAISFGIKSTNPAIVGGDNLFDGFVLDPKTNKLRLEDEERIEAVRQTLDRIAYAGKVPVNVSGNVGDFVIPVEGLNDSIALKCLANPTLEEYLRSVGKVKNTLSPETCMVIVKIV